MNNLVKKIDKANTRFFKHFVLAIEKAKFKLIDTLFPNYKEKTEARIKKYYKKKIDASTKDGDLEQLRNEMKSVLLNFRKEYEQRQNSNYHLNESDPQETIDFLEWNKQIHKQGLIKNSILISIASLAAMVSFLPHVAIGLIIFESLCAVINAECVNLQNHNIQRLKAKKAVLDKIAQSKIDKTMDQYGDGVTAAADAIKNAETLPTPEELISKMSSEQRAEFYAMLQNSMRSQTNQDTHEKVGGK